MLKQLKACTTLGDIASLLGYKDSTLAYLIYQIPDASKYVSKKIPKKNGGLRQIEAPIDKIKELQRRVSKLLYSCIEEIDSLKPYKNNSSFGFLKTRNITNNAHLHRRSKFVFNTYFENFFGTIHIGRIIGFFAKDKYFALNPAVSKILAQICCNGGVLPQGAPTSPVISHLIGTIIDGRALRLAKRHGCTYSRYVDDLTFSTNKPNFPSAIAICDQTEQGWTAGPELVDLSNRAGFTLNAAKTRMSLRGSRQMVTGLVANAKANVSVDYRRQTRAMCHSLFMGKKAHRKDFFINDDKDQLIATLPAVEGRLGFQYDVDHRFDKRSSSERLNNRSARDRTFYQFLVYKIFVSNHRPLIITEGDTDKIYIECASKVIKANDPRFIDLASATPRLGFNVLNRGTRLAQVMGWTGGTGPIQNALINFLLFRKKYPARASSPVIVLVDNDQGCNKLFNVIRDQFSVDIQHADQSDFFKLRDNLYLIKTPSLPTKSQTFIESFLPPDTLSNQILGRNFTANNEYSKATHYGKTEMANYVFNNQGNVSFDGFLPLLERIRAVFHDAGLQQSPMSSTGESPAN